jgi:hypothetical protein
MSNPLKIPARPNIFTKQEVKSVVFENELLDALIELHTCWKNSVNNSALFDSTPSDKNQMRKK